MRIALLINLAPRKLGSLEQWLVAMAAEAQARGHELDIFGRLPIHEEITRMLRSWGTVFATTDELEQSPVAAVKRLSGYDLLYVNMFQPRTKTALLAYAAWPAKVVLVDHTSGAGPEQLLARTQHAVSRALDKVSLARVDGLVAVSEYVRQRDILRFGLHGSRTRTIYNGVDARLYRPRAHRIPGAVRIAAVAHLTREKGIDVLLRAVARMKQRASVRIVGDGPMESEFRSLAHDLRVMDRVKFMGLRNDVATILSESDIFVHPARWQEAFGLTLAEGMACGCAVVASETGGIPELIDHDRSGLLVSPNDDAALGRALDELAASSSRRASLGANGRQRVLERFTLERCVDEHLDYIEEIALDDRPVLPAVQRVPGALRNVLIGDPAVFDPKPAKDSAPPPEFPDDDADDKSMLN